MDLKKPGEAVRHVTREYTDLQTLDCLDDMGRKFVSRKVSSSIFILPFKIADNLKVGESPGMPSLVPTWIKVRSKKIRV